MDRAIGVANVFVALVALSWFFYFLATRVAAVAVTLEVLVRHGLASIPERGTEGHRERSDRWVSV